MVYSDYQTVSCLSQKSDQIVWDGDLTWSAEHTEQYTGGVLWNCAPGTCMVLLTSATPIKSIKRKKKKNLTSVDTHALEVLSSCLYIIIFNLMTVVQDISYMIMCQRAEFNMFL